MNGAHSLIQTLANCGVEVCFGNPGTTEMHFVASLDSTPEMRAVLCLFEGVATGAADGYRRMAGKHYITAPAGRQTERPLLAKLGYTSMSDIDTRPSASPTHWTPPQPDSQPAAA